VTAIVPDPAPQTWRKGDHGCAGCPQTGQSARAAADREANHRTVAVFAVVVALLSFLILQSATGSWRLAAGLMVSMPVALTGGVLVAPLVGGLRSIGVLVALFALLALALRQALVFVRRARELEDDAEVTRAQAVQQALRECAPAFIGTALVTAAIMAAPAVRAARRA
jgi:Cu/Ag efflux pump CusA